MWSEFRSGMPVTRDWSYLDHAAVAPLPATTRDVIHKWCTEAAEQGDTVWGLWRDQVELLRPLFAGLINADPEEIALVPSTTSGINLVAEGFPWEEGDNVVTLANEFPSNLYPWMNQRQRGVETRAVEAEGGVVDIDRLAAACDQRTRIVSISWVGYASGYRVDVAGAAAMAHDRGALLFLDAIQGLGVFPLDVRAAGVDFLAADGHKWMLGPEGAGLFYVRRELLDLLRPLGVGWKSVRNPYQYGANQFELRGDAARYEGGTLNMAGFIGLAASLRMLSAHGLGSSSSPIADRVLEVADYARERLDSIGAELISCGSDAVRSGIVTFRGRRPPEQDRARCLQAGVAVSCRGGGLRISPHAYNNEADIDRLIDVVNG